MSRRGEQRGFAGPAVDGPLKGRLIVHETPVFRVVEAPNFRMIRPITNETKTEQLVVKYHEYEYDERARYWRWRKS